MAKFVFHLEGVLRQRTNVEQRRQREVAIIQGEMTALEASLRALDASLETSNRDIRENRLLGKLDLAFLAGHRRYVLSMHRRATRIAEQMTGVKQRLDEAKRHLSEASIQRKIIEKLRERQFQNWREALARSELAEMDEIAMQLSHRNIADAEAGAA